MRRSLLVVAVLLLVVVAGCGGSERTSGSSAADIAGIVPASAPLLVAFETDPDSKQWQQADDLLSAFPGKQKLLNELRQSLSNEGIDVEDELLPALGDETYLAVLDFENGGDNVVVLTKPRDEEKLQELLRESDDKPVTREIDGWTAIAEKATTLDRLDADGDRLADVDWFQEAQGRVEEDALVTFFANGEPIAKALRSSGGIEGCDLPTKQGTLRYAAGTVAAEDNGIRLRMAAESDGAPEVSRGESLLSQVPAGAFAYLGSPGFDVAGLGVIDQVRCALESQGAPDVERELGVGYEEILDLFAGGFGLYTRPAALIPEVTLLLAPKDDGSGLKTLDALAEKAAAFGAKPRTRTIGEIEARELQLGPVSILYGARDGHIAVTTARAGIEALVAGGDSLEDDQAFKDAADAAGVGDDEVFAYFDLRRLADLADDVAGFAGGDLPADARANLEPLKTFLLWGDTSDPNDVELGAFLGIGS